MSIINQCSKWWFLRPLARNGMLLVVLGLSFVPGPLACQRTPAPVEPPRAQPEPRKEKPKEEPRKEQLLAALQKQDIRHSIVEVDESAPGKPVVIKVALTDYMLKEPQLALLENLRHLKVLDLDGSSVAEPWEHADCWRGTALPHGIKKSPLPQSWGHKGKRRVSETLSGINQSGTSLPWRHPDHQCRPDPPQGIHQAQGIGMQQTGDGCRGGKTPRIASQRSH